jgi:transcriptional regulator with XRE-family HTH domain
VARARSKPASTPFGAWLDQWLKANPDVTFESLAGDLGVTKSAISLWISTEKPIKVDVPKLRRLAERTGAPIENLERLVYGNPPAGPAAAPSALTLSPEILDAIEERIRRAFREELKAALAELQQRPPE